MRGDISNGGTGPEEWVRRGATQPKEGENAERDIRVSMWRNRRTQRCSLSLLIAPRIGDIIG